jgi:hypothetical protein
VALAGGLQGGGQVNEEVLEKLSKPEAIANLARTLKVRSLLTCFTSATVQILTLLLLLKRYAPVEGSGLEGGGGHALGGRGAGAEEADACRRAVLYLLLLVCAPNSTASGCGKTSGKTSGKARHTYIRTYMHAYNHTYMYVIQT